MRVLLGVLLPLVVLVSCAGSPTAAVGGEDPNGYPRVATPQEVRAQGLEVATFAAGCFWCVETPFEGLPGVRSVVSGFMGGDSQRPSYDQVSRGGTGHAEAVQIVFDPKVTTYARLLHVFWRNVDPFAAGRQFCDVGTQYRGAIFVHGPEQRRLAEAGKAEVAKRFGKPAVVEIAEATAFWPAENYHQDFYKKDPIRYKTYRLGCGRDARLRELWGAEAGH